MIHKRHDYEFNPSMPGHCVICQRHPQDHMGEQETDRLENMIIDLAVALYPKPDVIALNGLLLKWHEERHERNS